MERDFGLVPWPCFVEFVHLLFGPLIFAKSLGQIKALYRTGMEEDYSRRFLALLSCCEDLAMQHKIPAKPTCAHC
jgi:hypothetical protein